jgi:hypothetical protein
MFGKDKSPEFYNQMFKDKSGGNNPNALCTKVTNIISGKYNTFDTFKKAVKFVGGRIINIRLAREKKTLYKNKWLIETISKDSS